MNVEVAVLGSPSLIVLNMVSEDVMQHLKKKSGTASPPAVSVRGQKRLMRPSRFLSSAIYIYIYLLLPSGSQN